MQPHFQTVGHSHLMEILKEQTGPDDCHVDKICMASNYLGNMSGKCCSISSLFQSTFSLLWQLFNPSHRQCQPPTANGFTLLFTIPAFSKRKRQTTMCLYMTLLLPCIKCCLLIKMSLWQGICRKEWGFFCPLPCQWNWMVVSYPREIFDHPACASSVGSAVCERGTVTQLWQPSGTSDGWHARMGHAAFPGACVDRLSLRISHSASVRLIAGHAGHRCDTWISLL